MNHFTFRIRKPEKLHDSSEDEENSDLGIDGVCILPPSPSYPSRSDSRYRASGNPISAPQIDNGGACSSFQVRVDDSLLELMSNPEMPMCSSSKDATERNTSVTTGNSHYIYVMCHCNYVRTCMLIAYVSRVLQNLIMI